jgi:hypothetical protein
VGKSAGLKRELLIWIKHREQCVAMKKRIAGFEFVVLAACLTAASLCPSVRAANWRPVTAFTGSASQTTAEFHIGGSEWRINWSYSPNGQDASLTAFSFFVFPHGETANYVDYVVQYGASNTSGTLNIHEGPKLYYLKILAANTPGYTITVEYDADSVVSDSLLAAIIAAVIIVPTVAIIIMAIFVRKKYRKRESPTTSVQPPPPPPPPPPP